MADDVVTFQVHWHPEPGVLDGLVVLTVLYLVAVGPLREWLSKGTPFPKKECGFFFLGVLAMFIAVGTPIEQIGESYLFSVHMFQHVILIYIVPVLFLLGLPDFVIRPIASMEWSGPLLRFFTHPVVAFLTFNALFYGWHIPGFYEWALRDPFIHMLEHATFIGASFLMWWPYMPPLKDQQPIHEGLGLLYILALSIAQTPIFAFLSFSSEVFYPTYARAARITHLSPIQDQILGGIIMKLSAALVMFLVLGILFFRWYRRER